MFFKQQFSPSITRLFGKIMELHKILTYLIQTVIALMLMVGCGVIAHAAGYKDYIGYTLLQAELGGSIPDGSNVRVAQVEAEIEIETDVWAWMPDVTDSQFSLKTINNMSGAPPEVYSNHATGVGKIFYGNNSIAPGINTIDSYAAGDWLGSGFLNLGSTAQPLSSQARVANHSWVGRFTGDDSHFNSKALRRLDWVIGTDEFIQTVGMNNGTNNRPLLGSAFNAIAVGVTDGDHAQGTVNVDTVYTSGRTAPHIVAPFSYTSSSTPVVAAAAALLVETGHRDSSLSTDPLVTYTDIPDAGRVYNAERSEVVKAALMAGADRITHNEEGANITDYRIDPANQSTNGLDARYGAGQLNIYNSYHIIAGGEQNSLEDDSGGEGNIDWYGFDYDPYFGGIAGSDSNSEASYYFTADEYHDQFYASLVWNIDIDGGSESNFDDTAILYDLDLHLFKYDIMDGWSLFASSTSSIDNTENLWLSLENGQYYWLKVAAGEGQGDFLWDYGLAWQIVTAPVPIPGAVWLLGSGLVGVVGFRRKFKK